MSIGRQMDKEVMLHVHNGILLNYKKECIWSVLMRWMKLESIIQTLWSQKEKHQYSVSSVTQLCLTLCDPWTIACQAPLSMGFFRQESSWPRNWTHISCVSFTADRFFTCWTTEEDPLEEGMATHSRIVAWIIPWTEQLGGLQSIGLHRVRQGWSNSALFTKII